MGQFCNRAVLDGAERISRVFARWNSRNLEFRRKFGWQVFKAMYSQIYTSIRERLLNFLCEHSLRTNLRECNVGDLIAGGVNDLNLDFVSAPAQQRRDVVGLPESELRSAGAYLQTQA